MGGLGSFTLPATYPSVFSEAMPLDGGFDDCCTTAPYGVANFDINAAVDRSANVHWVPYVISDSYTDELSPYPNNAELINRLQNAQDRFTLFSTTMPEHITTDSADGFSTQVATLHGTPLVKTDPGTIDYTWCADVVDAKRGLGPTSVYWLSGLRQRTTAGNAVSSIAASDSARPEPQVNEQLQAWATNPPDAPPMQVVTGSWNLSAADRPQPQLRLQLTNVAALTVDAEGASLPTAIVNIETDGATRLTITHLRRGTRVMRPDGPTLTVGPDGTITVDVAAGASALSW
jgi:hypothetical protein